MKTVSSKELLVFFAFFFYLGSFHIFCKLMAGANLKKKASMQKNSLVQVVLFQKHPTAILYFIVFVYIEISEQWRCRFCMEISASVKEQPVSFNMKNMSVNEEK